MYHLIVCEILPLILTFDNLGVYGEEFRGLVLKKKYLGMMIRLLFNVTIVTTYLFFNCGKTIEYIL
jgi:hypothetical protein